MNTKLKAFWLLAKVGANISKQRKEISSAQSTIKWQAGRVKEAERVIRASSGHPVINVDLCISPRDERKALVALAAPADRVAITEMLESVETRTFNLTGMLHTRMSIRFPMGEYHHQVHDMLDALTPRVIEAAQRVVERGLHDVRAA